MHYGVVGKTFFIQILGDGAHYIETSYFLSISFCCLVSVSPVAIIAHMVGATHGQMAGKSMRVRGTGRENCHLIGQGKTPSNAFM